MLKMRATTKQQNATLDLYRLCRLDGCAPGYDGPWSLGDFCRISAWKKAPLPGDKPAILPAQPG